MTKNDAIGVFDSGIGGLTVLRALLSQLPGESFVYFGDTARVPYGNKSHDTVLRFSRENTRFLIDRGVKFIVVACNSASAQAVPELQKEFDVPIVGVIEPGARAAVKVTQTARIGVIGTAATIRSGAYQAHIKRLNKDAVVQAKPCPLFVPLVEEGWVDSPITRQVVETYLDEFLGHDIDAMVLGCTHYPLLHDVIADVLGDGVTLVDSAVETAAEVHDALEARGLLRDGGPAEFQVYLSDIAPNFRDIGERILGRAIPDVHLLTV